MTLFWLFLMSIFVYKAGKEAGKLKQREEQEAAQRVADQAHKLQNISYYRTEEDWRRR